MKTRTGLALGTFLVLGLSATSASALDLKGSDTLEDVTKKVITDNSIANLVYVGGGSGGGESAMSAGSQHIAPMSRALGTAVCAANPAAQQLAIALDGIVVVSGNTAHGDSTLETASTGDDCTDNIGAKTVNIPGCTTAEGCDASGNYAFADWKDVLAVIYGGQYHGSAAKINLAAGAACTYAITQTATASDETSGDGPCASSGQVCFPSSNSTSGGAKCGTLGVVGYRNPARINCAPTNTVRKFLFDNYGQIFNDAPSGGSLPGSCRSGTCTTLRHAYRRDDLSGTTDAFVSFLGLQSIPPFTKAFANNSPMPDRAATANAFCNAGPLPMNKGDADYLDNDPIRRAVDHVNTPPNRFGQEQVSQFDSPVFGGNNADANCNKGAIPTEHGSSTEVGVWPNPNLNQHDPATGDNVAAVRAEMGSNGIGGVARGTSTRTCLGGVLSVSVPTNFDNLNKNYFGNLTNTAVTTCDIVAEDGVSNAVASVIMDTQHSSAALCPNGQPQPCLLPYKFDPAVSGTHNFNCLSTQLNPTLVGGYADRRVFNLRPVDEAGHYRRDAFLNPNIPLAAARQARVVSAYYRIHTTSNTDKNGSIPSVPFCQTFSSTDQIGCLVKANTCSIGYAGREAADKAPGPFNNFAAKLETIPANAAFINNKWNQVAGISIYPAARVLWLNTLTGFGTLASPELDLFNAENSASIDAVVSGFNFLPVPTPAGGTGRLRACGASN